MTRHLALLALGALTLAACSAPLQGAEADLHAIATPDPVPQIVRAVPQPPPGPTPGQGQFRAWVPRDVAPSGDIIDGHWLTISATPPPVEVLEPVTPMPRAPKPHLGAPSRPERQQASVQVPVQPQAAGHVPLLPSPAFQGLQQGLTSQDGQRQLRMQRMPLAAPTLGGQ
jgi:hypothetical protein